MFVPVMLSEIMYAITDLPLVCDDLFATVLQRLRVDAVVLSTDLLNLWRVRDLVNNTDPIRLLSAAKQPPSTWRLNSDERALVKLPDYLVEVRLCNAKDSVTTAGTITENEEEEEEDVRVCLNTSSAWEEFDKLKNVNYNCKLPTTLKILPESKVKHFLFHHSTAIVMFVDTWNWFDDEGIRNLPSTIFVFTAPIYACSEIVKAKNRLTMRSTLQFPLDDNDNSYTRETFKAWKFFLNNEALLPDDKVYRFSCALGDPNDTLYWRNLLAQLFKTFHRRRSKKQGNDGVSADENIHVIINLSVSKESEMEIAERPTAETMRTMENDGGRRLTLLRFKRFLAFFARVKKVLDKGVRSDEKRIIQLYWSVDDRLREFVYRLASWMREEALIGKSWGNLHGYTCFVGPSSIGLPDDTEIVGCQPLVAATDGSGSGGGGNNVGDNDERLRFNTRADNVIGLVHDSLLLRGYYKCFDSSQKFLVENGYSVVSKHFSGAPLLKFL